MRKRKLLQFGFHRIDQFMQVKFIFSKKDTKKGDISSIFVAFLFFHRLWMPSWLKWRIAWIIVRISSQKIHQRWSRITDQIRAPMTLKPRKKICTTLQCRFHVPIQITCKVNQNETLKKIFLLFLHVFKSQYFFPILIVIVPIYQI